MKKILIVSSNPGAGQTTLTVNLGSGLAGKGYRVMIAAAAGNRKLHDYLANLHREGSEERERAGSKISLALSLESSDLKLGMPIEGEAAMDYILMTPEQQSECEAIIGTCDHVLVCIDFSGDDEIKKLIKWEQESSGWPVENPGISLIVPNKMNSKEWEHNSKELFALTDYFGIERIADPIPACERVHDLFRLGKTVWQIDRQNLQDAFDRLLETVENL